MPIPSSPAEQIFSVPFASPFAVQEPAQVGFYILAENGDRIQLEGSTDLILLEAA